MVLSSINSPIEPFLSSTCSLWPFSLGGIRGGGGMSSQFKRRDNEGRNSFLNGRSDGGTGSILECQILNRWKHKYLLYWSLHHRSTFVKKKHSASLERSNSYHFFQLILHLHWRKEVLNRTNKLVRIRNYPHRLKRMKQVLPYYWNAIIMTRYIHQRVSTLNYFRYTVPTLLLFPVAAVSDMNGGRVDLILQGNWYISAHCAHCTRAAPNTGGARVNGILVCRIEVKPFQWEKDTFWEKCGPFPDLFCSFCRLCRGEEVL